MANEDIKLTFNPAPFLDSMKKIDESMQLFSEKSAKTFDRLDNTLENLPKNMKKFQKSQKESKKTTQDVSKGIKKSFGGLTLLAGKLKVAMQLIQAVVSQIPEIGMTFNAVKSIIVKNLLWPLRKELIPILQRVLDWARNNRGMFLKWGGVILNIFKTVKTVFVSVVNLIKSLTKSLMDSLKGFVDFAGKDITNIINLLIFKLTALFLVLEAKLSPIFAFIGEELGEITKSFIDFFKAMEDIGAFEKFFEIMSDLGVLLEKTMVVLFKTTTASIKSLLAITKGFFKGLGEVDGLNDSWKKFADTVGGIFDLLAKLMELVGDKLGPVFETFGKIIGKIVGGQLKRLLDILDFLGKGIEKLLELAVGELEGGSNKNTRRVNDAVLRPDGSVIETNPKDTLVAMKNPMQSMSALSNSGGESKNVTIGDIQIALNVTEGNSKQAGINFADGLSQQLRQSLLDQFVLQGNR